MKKEDILTALKELREKTPKKKFSQTIDLVISLKEFNTKSNKVSVPVKLPYGKGKKNKICGLIDQELEAEAKKNLDFYILKENFIEYANNKKKQKKLTSDYGFFIAQASIMTDIAKTFGKTFGPRGAMPDPKVGSVVAPVAKLGPLVEKLRDLVKVETKSEAALKCPVGKESMKDEEIYTNIQTVYDAVIKELPQEQNNVKDVMLKMTMGPLYVVGKGLRRTEKKEEEIVKVEEKDEKK